MELTLIQLSQLVTGDDSEDGGRGPKILKPIFNKIAKPQEQTEIRSGSTTPAPPQKQETTTQPELHNAPATAPQPKQESRQVLSGRPEAMRKQGTPAKSIGGMFQRARTTLTQEQAPSTAMLQTTTAPIEEKLIEKPAITTPEITKESLTQAWTSFAMQLPEKERALADRMKIIQPTLGANNDFTISVDNQLVAELFEGESKRIVSGISSYLKGATLTMKIEVNKVKVEQHVYDRTKQYEMLAKKNPTIEKLRKALNLELS